MQYLVWNEIFVRSWCRLLKKLKSTILQFPELLWYSSIVHLGWNLKLCNFFLIRKAWMMPVRTDAFSQLCFSQEQMQWILFLMGNQFSCHTYLSNKFLTRDLIIYNPKFSLFLTCLMSKVPLHKPREQYN